MIIEELDPNSGAILFKKDRESQKLEDLEKLVNTLDKKISKLEKRIKELESSSESV